MPYRPIGPLVFTADEVEGDGAGSVALPLALVPPTYVGGHSYVTVQMGGDGQVRIPHVPIVSQPAIMEVNVYGDPWTLRVASPEHDDQGVVELGVDATVAQFQAAADIAWPDLPCVVTGPAPDFTVSFVNDGEVWLDGAGGCTTSLPQPGALEADPVPEFDTRELSHPRAYGSNDESTWTVVPILRLSDGPSARAVSSFDDTTSWFLIPVFFRYLKIEVS